MHRNLRCKTELIWPDLWKRMCDVVVKSSSEVLGFFGACSHDVSLKTWILMILWTLKNKTMAATVWFLNRSQLI